MEEDTLNLRGRPVNRNLNNPNIEDEFLSAPLSDDNKPTSSLLSTSELQITSNLNKINIETIGLQKTLSITENPLQLPKIGKINQGAVLKSNKMATLNIDHALKIIPLFSGKSSELHKFCACVEIIWDQLTDNNDKALFMKILNAKLCNEAYEVVHYKKFGSWEELKLALEKTFLKRRSQGAVTAELVNIIQNKNESVKTYAAKVESLLHEVNDICIANEDVQSANVIKKLNEAIALNSFQDGLKDNLKTIIKAHHFDNLNDAIAQAIEEEICHKPTYNNNGNANSNGSSQNSKRCSFCKKYGHTFEKCYKRKNQNSNFRQNISNSSSYTNKQPNLELSNPQNENKFLQTKVFQNNSNANSNIISCNYCKREGHSIAECYRRKYNESQKQAGSLCSPNVKVITQPSTSGNQLGSEEMNTAIRVQNLE